MKEKLNSLAEEVQKNSFRDQHTKNSFRVLSIFYITNFCETRKINSNAIRVLFLLLNFRKSRKWVLI